MSDIGAVIFQWLRRIGLEYAIPAFESMQITSPHALMNMQWEHYDALGIHDPDDRKRLYELVQRVRDASRKGSEVRRSRQSLAPDASSPGTDRIAHARSSLSNNMPSRESILGADMRNQQAMEQVTGEYHRDNMHISVDDTGEEDEDSGLISSARLGSRIVDDSVDAFPVHNTNSTANVPTNASRQPPAPVRRLRVMPSASAAFRKREAEAAALAAAGGNPVGTGVGSDPSRATGRRRGVPRQSISNQPLPRRNLPSMPDSEDSAMGSREDFGVGGQNAEIKQRRTSVPRPGSRVPSSTNAHDIDAMNQDSDEVFDTDGVHTSGPVAGNKHQTVKIDSILPKDVLVDPDGPRIRVVVRKRPMSRKEVDAQEMDVVNVVTKTELQVHEIKRKVDLTRYTEASEFAFDGVFDETVSTSQLYQYTARPLISTIFNGANATCFAYGQTGSGKTYTMMGNLKGGTRLYDAETGQCDSKAGLYVLAARDIFAYLDAFHEANPVEQVRGFDKRGSRRYCVVVSFYEIYGGKLFDLLNNRKPLKALVDAKGDVNVLGIVEQPVFGVDGLLKYIDHGNSIRSTGSTGANEDSSRSHAVLQITLAHAQADGNGGLNVITDPRTRHVVAKGKFSFIDLAGSERGADTFKNDRKTRLEGAEINKSLLALKECIRSLYHQADYNPFRGSKLTQVLKDSFIGDAHTVMIATISPNQSNTEHTLNTLRYAYRLKEISGSDGETEYDPPYGLRGQVNEYGEEPYDNRAESLVTVQGGPLGGLSNFLAKQAGMYTQVEVPPVGGPGVSSPSGPTSSSRNTAAQARPGDAASAPPSSARGSGQSGIPAAGRASIPGRPGASLSATSVNATLAAIDNASAVASAVASARITRESSLPQRKSSSVAPSAQSRHRSGASSIPSQASRGSSINARVGGRGASSRTSIPTLPNRQASTSVPPPSDASPSSVSTPSPRRNRSIRNTSTTNRMRALSGSPITSPLRRMTGSPHTPKTPHGQQDSTPSNEMAVDVQTPASVRRRKELTASPLVGSAQSVQRRDDSITGSPYSATTRGVSQDDDQMMEEDMEDVDMEMNDEIDTSILSSGASNFSPQMPPSSTGGTRAMVSLEPTDTAMLNNHITALRRLEMLASREKLEIKAFLSGPDEPAISGREGMSGYVSRMKVLLDKKIDLMKSLSNEFSEYRQQYGPELDKLTTQMGENSSSTYSSPHGKVSPGMPPQGYHSDSVTSPIPVKSPLTVQDSSTPQSYHTNNEL